MRSPLKLGWRELWKRLARAALATIPVYAFYLAFCNYLEPTQIGIVRNTISGEMWLQKGGGWFLTAPWTRVARVDTRPMRVAITTAGHGYSAKLVRFVPEHWKEFVATEGFHYYWWYNRISFNLGYGEEYRGMRDIMRGYAYGAKQYPFCEAISEYEQR